MNAVYVPFFNEAGPHLERQLEAFLDWGVKKVYYVDGPFPTFPHQEGWSTDGSRELIESYPFTKILNAGVNYMPIKTNLALHRAAKDGARSLLIMGADEYIEGDLNNINLPDKPLINVQLIEHNPTGAYNRWENVNPRLIGWPGLVRSVDVHWLFFFMNTLLDNEGIPLVEGIVIHCDDNYRPAERDKLMTKYQDEHSPVEKQIIRDKYLRQVIDMDYPPTRSLSGAYYWTCGCITWNDGNRLRKCSKHLSKTPQL